MMGFLFGTLCLLGLAMALRAGLRRRGWGRGRGRPGIRGGVSRQLFDRLETTPGQEKLIAAMTEQLGAKAAGLREEAKLARAELSAALRADVLDERGMRSAAARLDVEVEAMREALIGAASQLHEALEPRQREELARRIERGGERGPGRLEARYRAALPA